MNPRGLAALLQGFFAERLLKQRRASPHTVTAYRNAFRLLLRYAAEELRKTPSNLTLEDLDAAFLGRFLDHLERERGNSARTRNARLAALHAFYRYVSFTEPSHALLCQRVLAIPSQRFDRALVEFLTADEAAALTRAPDTRTWIGRRDKALLITAIETGLRVSELTNLRRQDVQLERGAHVRCLGKGRKLRCTPIRSDVSQVLNTWLREVPDHPEQPIFPNADGGHLSGDAVARRVRKYAALASEQQPTLKSKHVTPHSLRHTTAMRLLHSGVDRSVIALWLGHESMETTEVYLHADMTLKEQALARGTPDKHTPSRFKPDDDLLRFLDNL